MVITFKSGVINEKYMCGRSPVDDEVGYYPNSSNLRQGDLAKTALIVATTV